MSRTPIFGTRQFIVLLALLMAVLACNYPDATQVILSAATENCNSVNRERYEDAAARLGVEPETPKYPETAGYEVCYGDGQVTSVRMSEGYGPEEEQPAAAVEAEAAPETDAGAGTGTTPTSFAGTYMGEELEVPPSWELVKQEFTISIAADGAVSGLKIYEIQRASLDSSCNVYWGNGHTTLIGGTIDGSEGLVSVETEAFVLSDFSDCGGLYNYNTYESYCEVAQITISGDRLEIRGDGSEGCSFVYFATKASE
ncbi:MAG: hypothetical protein JW862_05325 [Anaerolineales bacterium]|nr:hypothetical protein [Anaerolineales bacterium]